jgi:hypothetical protein
VSDSQAILSAQDTPPTTREVLETVRKHLNTLGGAPDGAPAQGGPMNDLPKSPKELIDFITQLVWSNKESIIEALNFDSQSPAGSAPSAPDNAVREFLESFHITVVDNFYKDVTLVLEKPHTLAIRLQKRQHEIVDIC